MIAETIEFQKKVFLRTQQVVSEMQDFIKICKDFKIRVLSIETIAKKEFYNQFESILLGQSNKIFKSIEGPVLALPSFEISITPSLFPDILNHYNEIGFISDATLYYSEGKKQFQSKLLKDSSRMLYLNKEKLLITGGVSDRKVYIFNIISNALQEINCLTEPRHAHTMAWVNGYPAVISGAKNSGITCSVEILRNGKWDRISDINIGRTYLSSCNYAEKTFLIGGKNWKGTHEEKIEMWEKNTWKELEILAPGLLRLCGANWTGTKLMIFGGIMIVNEKASKSSYVHSMKYNQSRFMIEKELKTGNTFDFNLWKRQGNEIIAFQTSEELIAYPTAQLF